MNNITGNISESSISTHSNLYISNKIINSSSTSIQPILIKPNPKISLIPRSAAITPETNSNRSNIPPFITLSNSSSRTVIKTTPLIISSAFYTDDTQAPSTIINNTNYDISTYSQPQLTHTFSSMINQNTNNNINFTSAVVMKKTLSREQAIVFSSIDGIPQVYILAIRKIVLLKNIKFVSRISNNRFFLFLSSKKILNNLIQTIKCNNVIQIRGLINLAKIFIISNVCSSIPNQATVDA